MGRTARIVNHDGTSRDADGIEFGPPLPEVTGRLLSITSTRRAADGPTPTLTTRLWFASGSAALGISVGVGLLLLVVLLGVDPAPNLTRGLLFAPFGAGALLGLFIAKPTYHCSYLGTEGLVLHTQTGSSVSTRTLRFRDADQVEPSIVHDYYSGVYMGSTLTVTWSARGATVFAVRTEFKKDSQLPTDSLVHLANAAVATWRSTVGERIGSQERALF